MKLNKIGTFGLHLAECAIRIIMASQLLTVLAVVGGMAVVGGSELESTDPGMMDDVGGWETIHLIVDVYIILIIVIPVWVLVAFRERQIYNEIRNTLTGRKGSQ